MRALASTSRPWSRATSPAHVFVIACGDLGWAAHSARLIALETGQQIDLLRLSPAVVAALADQAARDMSDFRALETRAGADNWRRPVFWVPVESLLRR